MPLTNTQAIASIAVMAVVTCLTRAMPFLLFDRGDHPPKIVLYLGRVLPPAIIAMLIVYCLKGVALTAYPFGIPELVGVAAVVIFHLAFRKMLLSIAGGTLIYMILVNIIF